VSIGCPSQLFLLPGTKCSPKEERMNAISFPV